MGRSVDFYAQAYPSTADDAFLTIYTLDNAGSTQTLNSTTACASSGFTKLELESQSLNDDLEEIQLRFRVHTAGETCYFDDAILCGKHLQEYLIPDQLQSGNIDQVWYQTSGYHDQIAYDLHPRDWSQETFDIIDNGTYKYLRLHDLPSNYHRLRLIGNAPFTAMTAATDTIPIDESGQTNLLVAYASYLMYEMEESPVSSEDIARYERESAKRYNKYLRLLRRHRMITPAATLRVP